MKFDIEDKATMKKLFDLSKKAQELAYVPYSHFRVGAVILTNDGKYVLGANIENASYGLSMCAERTCMFRTHLLGYKKDDILCLALIGDSTDDYAFPCGACRQVMAELLNLSCPIIIFNQHGEHVDETVKGLLPYSFTQENLK
ncbi:MAG: cytidine deaminase [Bacilli bacterium]|nr:cytidine deaminase [Bacilli bacterium]